MQMAWLWICGGNIVASMPSKHFVSQFELSGRSVLVAPIPLCVSAVTMGQWDTLISVDQCTVIILTSPLQPIAE